MAACAIITYLHGIVGRHVKNQHYLKQDMQIGLRMNLLALIMIEINLLCYRRHKHLLETLSTAESSRENSWAGGMWAEEE